MKAEFWDAGHLFKAEHLPSLHLSLQVKRAIGDDGKPALKQIGYISTYAEDKLEDTEQRQEFWARARFRLGRLRLPPNQIALIEQQLARRVPLPQQGE